MTGQDAEQSQLSRILRQIQRLAEQVRVTADRIQAETEEARRLAAIARDQTERSRALSRSGQQEANDMKGSIDRSLNPARDREEAPNERDG